VIPFKVMVGEEAKSMLTQLGDKAGIIEIDVFVAGSGGEEEGDKTVSFRGMRQNKERKARSSHSAYRAALMESARLKTQTKEVRDGTGKVTKRELIVPDPDKKAPAGDIQVVSFENPRAVGGLTIKVVPAGGDGGPENTDNPGGDQPDKGTTDPTVDQ
jgi:hypothetical protein